MMTARNGAGQVADAGFAPEVRRFESARLHAVPPQEVEAMANQAGPIIYTYTREQAIADGVLVDVTDLARGAARGLPGGFTVSVAMTRRLWDAVDVDHVPARERPACQDTQGRAHNVLWIAALAVWRARGAQETDFAVLLHVGRQRRQFLRAVVDASGVTIGFQHDEW